MHERFPHTSRYQAIKHVSILLWAGEYLDIRTAVGSGANSTYPALTVLRQWVTPQFLQFLLKFETVDFFQYLPVPSSWKNWKNRALISQTTPHQFLQLDTPLQQLLQRHELQNRSIPQGSLWWTAHILLPVVPHKAVGGSFKNRKRIGWKVECRADGLVPMRFCGFSSPPVWSTAPATKKWCQVVRSAAPVAQNHFNKPEDLMLQNANPLKKSAPGPPNSSDEHVPCTAPATETASLQILFKCPTPVIVFGNATKPSRFAHFWQGPKSLAPAMRNDIWTSKRGPKCWCALYILTSKCASRHNRVHFFDISISKSGPDMVCFAHFDFEMCFAPQQRALFHRRNFQKWSGAGVLCAFWLGNVLRATTACTFSTSQLLKVLRSWGVLCILTWKCASRHNGVQFVISLHLASWLRTRRFSEPTFRPSPEPQIIGKTQCFATFSRTWIFFLLRLSLFDLLSSSLLFSDSSHLCFSSVHIVGSLTPKLPSTSSACEESKVSLNSVSVLQDNESDKSGIIKINRIIDVWILTCKHLDTNCTLFFASNHPGSTLQLYHRLWVHFQSGHQLGSRPSIHSL